MITRGFADNKIITCGFGIFETTIKKAKEVLYFVSEINIKYLFRSFL